ncbi:MAG: type II secretion system protein, partial [Phycisphaerae bacterium]|nr:type II secretion system protein [Phycisphaerae bacterium]
MNKTRKFRAFTLVELLVVISIIALLLAILMPALGKARNMARLTTDTANVKQIANVTALYQSDSDGYVPVMLHKQCLGYSGIPAKVSFLSIPFQPYSGKPVDLVEVTGGFLDPDVTWDQDMAVDYFEKYLSDFYVCPYVRGSEVGTWFEDKEVVEIAPGAPTRKNYKTLGRNDSYSTWIWPRPKGYPFWVNHPWGG